MSLGPRDGDRADPPDDEPRMLCGECRSWHEHPCCPGIGWCGEIEDWTEPDPREECCGFRNY